MYIDTELAKVIEHYLSHENETRGPFNPRWGNIISVAPCLIRSYHIPVTPDPYSAHLVLASLGSFIRDTNSKTAVSRIQISIELSKHSVDDDKSCTSKCSSRPECTASIRV